MCHAYSHKTTNSDELGFKLFDHHAARHAHSHNDLLGSRFWLVVVAGGTLALYGVVANALLARLFVSRLNFRHSPFFFLGFVALFDTLVDLVYILLLTPPILSEYFNWVRLYLYWLPQARWLYLFGQIFKISSCFCLIVASFERYMMTRHWTFSGFDYRMRWFILGCAISGGIFVKLLTTVDIVVVLNRNCTRIFQRYSIGQAGKREWLPSFFNLLTVVLPFGTLVFLNGGIVLMLRHQNVQQLRSLITELTMGHDVMKIRRRNLRAATNTLLVIISAYLISNLLNMFLSVMEYLYPGFLQHTYPYQYRISSDCASLLTVVGNALRFPAHVCSNKEISEQLKQMLFPSPKEKKHRPSVTTNGPLTLRRFSERADNPWFSALLTTPRHTSESTHPTSGGSKESLRNGFLQYSDFPASHNCDLSQDHSVESSQNLTANCAKQVDVQDPVLWAAPIILHPDQSERAQDEENNELLYSCDYAYVDDSGRGSCIGRPSCRPQYNNLSSQQSECNEKLGEYTVWDLRFNPDEFRKLTNADKY
ncbi:G-protein coupled receptor daf-37 [Ditylenchus destructor]|uniref:G-protein coupled receptor daf-37 n=1 Tax=Ditylenchus destructor TaxID=166010 RepID=A0AAD4R4R3_9BILA|nr:G-protein coupled receptor daf-37 [Ditylenchus destructor]